MARNSGELSVVYEARHTELSNSLKLKQNAFKNTNPSDCEKGKQKPKGLQKSESNVLGDRC